MVRQSGRNWLGRCVVLLLAAAPGCALLDRPQIRGTLNHTSRYGTSAAMAYTVACPDVLLIRVPGWPEGPLVRAIDPEGRIDLGRFGRVRVEGMTCPEIARRLDERTGLPLGLSAVWVAEYRSRCVHLFGQVKGQPRAVPYQGPETVVELLQRTGGLKAGADLREVQVVRSHVADGRRPEVYHVDLHAIIVKGDTRTNLLIQPFDQIYVGETRRSSLASAVPPVLRPIYDHLVGLARMP